MIRFAMPYAIAAALLPAAPALAQDYPPPSPPPAPIYTPPSPAAAASGMDRVAWAPGQREAYERARAGWLRECRRRIAMAYARERDDGIGGGLIGAAVGGLIGNRIAGRRDRAFGTIAGAAVGAVAGAAIDKADSRDRPAESDYCESYLDYYAYTGTYQQQAQAYPVMMVAAAPMQHAAHAAPAQPECKEEVIYEDIEVPVSRPARRVIPRRPAPVKRVPDKRVPI